MKTLLIIDSSLGRAAQHIAKQITMEAAHAIGVTLTKNIEEAHLIFALGNTQPVDNRFIGKSLYLIDIKHFMRSPKKCLAQALTDAKPYSIPTAKANSLIDLKSTFKRVLAITACPTGVAHTFMAAEALSVEAKKRGWWIKVETRGSIGRQNIITTDEIALADFIIVATDIEVDLIKFSGKRIYRTSTCLALKNTKQELDNAVTQAIPYHPLINHKGEKQKKNQEKIGFYRHLMTGISYMLPMVVAGGLITAFSFAVGNAICDHSAFFVTALTQIGSGAALMLIIPILAGFIAFSISDRPGLTPGFIGGMLATNINSGFIGGIIAGFIAGYMVKYLNSYIHIPSSMESLKPLLILPVISSLLTGLIMIYIIGKPVAGIMLGLTSVLGNLGTANAILLGGILGGMMCIDMGGPLNKVAYAFGIGLLSSKTYAPMAAIMAAGMVPPLSMGIATLIVRNKFTKKQRILGKTALVLGMCFISEGAIPFAARDPVRVLSCCVIGGAVTGAISMAIGVQLMVPHGGLFVLLMPGVVTPVIGYLSAIVIGTLLAGISYAQVKSPEKEISEF
ncbi:PTS system fructose-specific EIIB'BC component [Candidatus Erwinia haradaeae]|uniref:PTS system fructose-specific EIIB'BC component n=1 Tax=Candidatus Erwinia haradaeae TaxID=1922217 RepID=A0A451DJT0_9GAMM|nr:PTS fructose transporter subunit IIBC [Candidatus Erwinia haradaeae]VFP86985.1 PTS system fructose-specific EIIB'BC component [Candidatus Erwinia haradaeae]